MSYPLVYFLKNSFLSQVSEDVTLNSHLIFLENYFPHFEI